MRLFVAVVLSYLLSSLVSGLSIPTASGAASAPAAASTIAGQRSRSIGWKPKSNDSYRHSPLFVSAGGSSSSIGSAAVTMSKEAWITPRLHNTAAFRSLAILGAISAAGFSSKSPLALLSLQGTAALHLFAFSTWFGTMIYTTFILGITMFRNLPRKTFGKLQAKLFPMYFSLSSVSIVLQLITLKSLTLQTVAAAAAAAVSSPVAQSTRALLVALVMTLLNQFLLEPLATHNMMRRYELEEATTTSGSGGGSDEKLPDSAEYKALKANFGKLHGFSSLTNLVALCAAAVHGFFLSAAFV